MENEVKIRDYQSGDFEQLFHLWLETGQWTSERADNEYIIENTLRLGGKLLVLEHAATKIIAGAAWLTTDGRRINLHHFAVNPQFQGRGLGHRLAKECIAFAKDMGMQIKLEVHKENVHAISLYEKYGFKYLGDYQVFIVREIEYLG